jgi:hypothetical protein
VRVSAGGWVEKVEEVTNRRFEAEDGWESTGERPAAGAQGARPRRAWLRWCSSLGGGRLVLGGLGGRAAPLGWHWTAANAPEEGGRSGADARQCAGTGVRGWLGAAGRRDARRGQGPGLLLRRRANPQVTGGRAEDASGTRA